MGEKNKDNNGSEINELFRKLVEEGVKNLEILQTESALEFLSNKTITNAPPLPFFNEFKYFLLLASINSKRYDQYLNKWMKTSSLTFFSEIKKLLELSKQKDEGLHNHLVSKFLNLVAIKKIRKVHISHVHQGLMDDRMLNLEKKFQENKIDYDSLSSELTIILKDIKERAERTVKN